MLYDAIVIGAGLGGLSAAAKLARAGRRVLVLERNPHIGGTSYIFRRGPWSFPMGPLSFSHPSRVLAALADAGVEADLTFQRNHFQLIAPGLDIVYSRPLTDLREDLVRLFPAEGNGLGAFFVELADIVQTVEGIDAFHPAFRAGPPERGAPEDFGPSDRDSRLERVNRFASTPAKDLLERLISGRPLRRLLGSMGTSPPEMSLLNLGIMWRAMSEVGIWFPSCGIHGLCRRLAAAARFAGGEIRLSDGVGAILVRGDQAVGVRTERGEEIAAEWIISNADYKKTFLELVPAEAVPPDHAEVVGRVPYTGSELCVYLGVRPKGIDFGAMRATHLSYRKEVRETDRHDAEDFDNQEVEICRWSDNAPDSGPARSASLILRAGCPYSAWARWRTGNKTRLEGYKETKNRLAWMLIRTVENVLPGLSASVIVMEAATPLTYRDWGGRTTGSVAGWSWSAETARLPAPILVRTPVRNLLTAGIYAATDLFLGGVSTALFTGGLAADFILESA